MDLILCRVETRPPGRRKRRGTWNLFVLQLALHAALLTMVLSVPGRADAVDRSGRSNREFEAKLDYCQDCHGPSGQGYRGYYPIPRLAGQQVPYIENQLRAFVERRRKNPIMLNVAHVLSPGMITALATSFRSFNPSPIGGAPREHVAMGKEIFENGVPDANIAACAACHGPDATGSEQIPRLAGQLYPYLVKTLKNWDKERGQNPAKPDTSATMLPIAHSLNTRQIEAIAAFVSYLK
jgi:cytochrome c553